MKTIYQETYTSKEVESCLLGLESKADHHDMMELGEHWRGGYINPLICYVLWCQGLLDRREDGFYVQPERGAMTAHKARTILFTRYPDAQRFSGRRIADAFKEARRMVRHV